MTKVQSFRDLNVYQKMKALHLDVHRESLGFPKFEMYELGSQARRSSNAAPAILAEGWGSRHTNIYLEAINRALGEIRETQHHMDVAKDKGYLSQTRFSDLDGRYDECGRMLEGLHQALSGWKDSTRTGKVVREARATYGEQPALPAWGTTMDVILEFDKEFNWLTPNT